MVIMPVEFSKRILIILLSAFFAFKSHSTFAQGGATNRDLFYSGKTINLILGYPPGGANDVFGRLVTKHIGRFIPGAPNVVLQHMAGAGSAIAANYVFNIAPRDGTVLALLVPTLALEERMGVPGVKYRSLEFNWIGRLAPAPNVTFMWHTSRVKKIEDAFRFESIVGATGSSATNSIYPSLLNQVVSTKFKLVKGYQGSGAAMLAMERGEIEGHSPTLDTLTSLHPDWVLDKKVNIIVQYLARRHVDLPDVPTAIDVAQSEAQKRVFHFAFSGGDIGKSILTTPQVPADRVAILRKAFEGMVLDPQFRAEAKQLMIGIDPLSADQLVEFVKGIILTSSNVADELKSFYFQ